MAKKGFTLSEVLITLGIIGILSSLVIPQLILKTRNREFKSRFLKTYSELNQAVSFMEQNGYDSEDEKYLIYTTYNYILDLKQFLKIASFQTSSDMTKVLSYNGSNYVYAGCPQPFSGGVKVKLANGVYVTSLRNCSRTWISIDLNGEKRPNRYGYDIFSFIIKDNKIELEKKAGKTTDGLGADSCSKVNPTILGEDGRSCAYWALIDKNPDDNSKSYWDSLD